MPQEERSYAAFVSYRHAEVDSAVAREVQHGLERFHVPAAVREQTGFERLSPVFRDKEELPVSAALGDDITYALAHASALVVVCSPRTKESQWVSREIDTFMRMHGRDRIFTVLAEGEPYDVIPPQLLSEVVDGEEHALEPLSCDYRVASRSQRRAELTRLAAAVLGVSYDSLAQRARRRRARIAAAVAGVAFALVTSIAAYALWSNARIRESYDQAMSTRSQLLVTEAQRELDSGDRLAAIELATASMPGADEDRPVSPAAARVLCDATHAYTQDDSFADASSSRLVAKYPLAGEYRNMNASPNGKYLVAMSQGGLVRAWDVASAELLFERQLEDPAVPEPLVLDDGRLLMADDHVVTCLDLSDASQQWTCDLSQEGDGYLSFSHMVLDGAGSSVIALTGKKVCRIDLASGKVASEVPLLHDDKDDWGVGGYTGYGAVAAVNGDRCVFSVAHRRNEDDSTLFDDLCVVDFASGSARVIPMETRKVCSLRFFGDTDLLVSATYGDEAALYGDSTVDQREYERRVERLDASTGTSKWKADVSLSAYGLFDSLQAMRNEDLLAAPKEGEDNLVMYCVGNVCQVFDAESGATVSRGEVTDPFVVAWPRRKDERTLGANSFLQGGKLGRVSFSNEVGNTCFAGQCVDAVAGLRMGDSTVLAGRDGILYRYVDRLDDDSFEPIQDVKDVESSYSFHTAEGVVSFQSLKAADAAQAHKTRIRLLDCEGQGAAWECVVEGKDSWGPELVGYSEARHELYLRGAVDYEANEVHMATLSTDTGQIEEWTATSDPKRRDDGVPFVPATDCGCQAGFVADVSWSYGHEEDSHVAVTDLSARSTQYVPLAPIVDSWDPESSFVGGNVYCSDDASALLVPVRGKQGTLANTTYEYVLYHPGGGYQRIATPLDNATRIVWSASNDAFAAMGESAVVAYDARGNVLLDAPLEGREVIGMRFIADKLHVVYDEQTSTSIVSYALDGSGVGVRTVLDPAKGYGHSSGMASDVQWISASEGRELARDPGDLCLFVPGERVAFLMDADSLEVCQEVGSSYGYDPNAGCFVVMSYKDDRTLGTFARRTADELAELGARQVGNSAMTEAERREYGL